MKKTTATFLIPTLIVLFLSISFMGKSQEMVLQTFNDYLSFQSNSSSTQRAFLSHEDIKGSAYLNEEFTLGSITTKNNIKYQGVPLRYNIYNDDIEFELKEGIFLAISNPESLKEVTIGDETFIYTKKINKKGESLGYYKLVTTGNTMLLTRYHIVFVGPQATTGYKAAAPAKLNRNANTFLLKVGDNNPIQIAKKKDLEFIFGTEAKKLLAYLKSEKLNVKKEKDLIKLVQFINLKD